MKAIVVAALVASMMLAGCGTKDSPGPTSSTSRPAIDEGKGAIAGLLIDDVYRPVPQALILVAKEGLTATTDSLGQFTFTNIEPGTYILHVQSDGHAAAPRSVEVKKGVYTEVEILADRLANSGGRTVTTEYSVFIPCAASVPAGSITFDCTGDQSGESFRASFTSNYTGYQNVTYLVTEMLANADASSEHGAYKVVVRDVSGGDPYWASKFITQGRYMKLVMKLNNVSADDTEHRNKVWNNKLTMQTALFPQGAFKGESQQGLDAACANDPTKESCFESRGLGPQAGVKAKFVQTLFIGAPPMNIDDYGVLKPT